jgi:nicotinic acid mononucleotide adenylyltransferase
MTKEVAVWDGRFQPPHVGHIEVIKAIISQFECQLAIMIIQSSEDIIDEYSKEVNKHHQLSRNPLTFWERYNLLDLAIKELPCEADIKLIGIPRPDLFWEIAKPMYPDQRFICLTDKDDYEKAKVAFWASLGESTRIVDISKIPKVSATEFKLALKQGHDWERFIPKASLDYFTEINGPQRFINATL